MTRKEGRLVEGGRPNKGREWTRPERGGENHGAQTTWRGRKMVILHPEPAPGYTPPLGATLLGRVVLLRRATAPGSRRLQRGAQSWVIPNPGRPGPGRSGRGERPVTEGRSEPPGAAETRGPTAFGPRAAGGSAGEGPPLLSGPFHHHPQPLGLPSLRTLRQAIPAQARPPPDRAPFGSPWVGPPRSPRTPAPSLTHLVSRGTWATPGLDPR